MRYKGRRLKKTMKDEPSLRASLTTAGAAGFKAWRFGALWKDFDGINGIYRIADMRCAMENVAANEEHSE